MTLFDYEKSLPVLNWDETLLKDASGYICDRIHDVADANTSGYSKDQEAFLAENFDWCERAISEFGWDGCGKDLHQVASVGEYLKIESDVYDEIDYILKKYAINCLRESGIIGYDELSDEIIGFLDEVDYNHYDKFEEINDAIEELLEEKEEK